LLTDIQFVDIWQNAKSPSEAIKNSGLTAKAVYKRVARYRKNGIPLKYFRLRKDVALLVKRAELAEVTNAQNPV
jgi:transposase